MGLPKRLFVLKIAGEAEYHAYEDKDNLMENFFPDDGDLVGEYVLHRRAKATGNGAEVVFVPVKRKERSDG